MGRNAAPNNRLKYREEFIGIVPRRLASQTGADCADLSNSPSETKKMVSKKRSLAARKAARTKGSAGRRRAAQKAVRTKGPRVLHEAGRKAVAQMPLGTVTREALARQTRGAAAKRGHADLSRAARRAVQTKGPQLRREAARKAVRTKGPEELHE